MEIIQKLQTHVEALKRPCGLFASVFEDQVEDTDWRPDGETLVRNDNLYQAYCVFNEVEHQTREIFQQLSKQEKRESAQTGAEMFGGLLNS